MEADLGAFLDEAATWRVSMGARDCMLFPADWVLAVTGRDPAAKWRGHYKTEIGAARIIRREGGEIELMRRGMISVGCTEIAPDAAQPGDTGIVLRPTAKGIMPTGAVLSRQGWAVLSNAGLWASQGGALAAWRPPHG